jgi:hypothetical protein
LCHRDHSRLPSSEQSKKFEGLLGIALSVKLLSDSSTMYKATYQRNFRAATECAVTFARDHVINVVPEGRLFLIYTNQSHDGNPLRSDETLYPGDALPTESNPLPRTEEEAIDSLWRFGKVPGWIDVAVARIEEGNTYLRLLCCGRFTADERLLYYQGTATSGFGIKVSRLATKLASGGQECQI